MKGKVNFKTIGLYCSLIIFMSMLFLVRGALAFVPAPTENWVEITNPDHPVGMVFDLKQASPGDKEFSYTYAPLPSSVQTVEEAVDTIIGYMNSFGIVGEYNKALYLHDWLVMNANYDYTYSNYHADGVLLKGKGVCQSYSEAYELLLNAAGIPCRVLTAMEMNHSWNLVLLNGEWCHIDVTWDDPNEGGWERHKYFGMNDDQIAKDHIWNRSAYPACTGTKNLYYQHVDDYITVASASDLREKLNQAAENQQKELTVIYIGTDPSFNIYDEFMNWYDSVKSKYGLSWESIRYNTEELHCSMSYTGSSDAPTSTPKPTPTATPESAFVPVKAPNFTFQGPDGTYTSANMSGNGLVLIFGRTTCGNTQSLLRSLQSSISKINDNGVRIVANMVDAGTADDLSNVLSSYPGYIYTYNNSNLMWTYLRTVGYGNSSVTLPCVFVINPSNVITYYSTGYVTDVSYLLNVIYAAVSGNQMPTSTPTPTPSASATPIPSNPDDFVVENGVLTKYKGSASEIIIPSNVSEIGDFVFNANKNITKVTIPSSVKVIGNFAFTDCYNLQSVDMADGVEIIGTRAFLGCSRLNQVRWPNTLTEIWSLAFEDCNELSEVTLYEGLDWIGAEAFKGTRVFSVKVPASVTELYDESFPFGAKIYAYDNSYAMSWALENGYTCSSLGTSPIPPAPTKTPTPEPVMAGDLNGDEVIDIRDLMRLVKVLNKENVEIFCSSDLNGDGTTDIRDLMRLVKYLNKESVVLN